MKATANVLLPLVARLKACPARDGGLTPSIVRSWARLRHRAEADPFDPPVMAALLLDGEIGGQLLDPAEKRQLLELVTRAIERYDQKINPPNRIGNLLVGVLKQTT